MEAVHSPVLQDFTPVFPGHHVHRVGHTGRKVIRITGLGDLRRCRVRRELSYAGQYMAASENSDTIRRIRVKKKEKKGKEATDIPYDHKEGPEKGPLVHTRPKWSQ